MGVVTIRKPAKSIPGAAVPIRDPDARIEALERIKKDLERRVARREREARKGK